jgi:uncharacterized membrane protein
LNPIKEDFMSDLIVIGYDDKQSAERAGAVAERLHQREALKLKGMAVLYADEHGHNHIDTPKKLPGITASAGAVWGAVVGFLVLAPVGAAIGGALGAGAGGLWGSMRQHGIDDRFRRALDERLTPGHAALVVMASHIDEDEVSRELGAHSGQLIKTTLDEDTEDQLAAALAG